MNVLTIKADVIRTVIILLVAILVVVTLVTHSVLMATHVLVR